MGDRADLVVIGAGTIGGWASVFARGSGLGRVVVVERGLAGMGASSRAAGIVRAQGGTPATVALGRWSIAFYNGQAAAYGTDSGFRQLGYLILAVTEDDERPAASVWRCSERTGSRSNGSTLTEPRPWRSPCRPTDSAAGATSRPTVRSIRPQRPRLLARNAGGRRRAARADNVHVAEPSPPGGGARVVAVDTDQGPSRRSESC
jgi:sarcosine oxidase subunit beta